MSIQYVVANIDLRTQEVVEVFPVVGMVDIMGRDTNGLSEAVAVVAKDGTCFHTLDLDHVRVWTVH
jgi:hypothetical protein